MASWVFSNICHWKGHSVISSLIYMISCRSWSLHRTCHAPAWTWVLWSNRKPPHSVFRFSYPYICMTSFLRTVACIVLTLSHWRKLFSLSGYIWKIFCPSKRLTSKEVSKGRFSRKNKAIHLQKLQMDWRGRKKSGFHGIITLYFWDNSVKEMQYGISRWN